MFRRLEVSRRFAHIGVAVLIISTAVLAAAQNGILPARKIAAGSTWVVSKTTRLNGLTIAKGATVTAPPGHSLTLTVDGADFPVKPGFYEGNVVLTVTNNIIVKYRNLAPHHFRAAVYIDNGKLVADKSVAAAVDSGKVSNKLARNVSLTSDENDFNGILVTGNSKYLIENPVIHYTGNGGDDFAGFGAALMSSGHADVTVDNAKIITRGAVRTAVFVGGDSTMHVNNSFIDVYNGVLPASYKFNISLGKMFEAPWVLGVIGNVRATNVVDNGVVYYNNSHIRTHGWGALSADDPQNYRLYATNTLIETVGSGYGSYAIGGGINKFSHCTFNVADVGVIIAGTGRAIFTDGTVVNSGHYGVTMHSGSGGSLTIEKGSVFNTKSTAIEVKGRGVTINVDNSKINAGNGIILQAMINDDPYASNPAGLISAAGAHAGVTFAGPTMPPPMPGAGKNASSNVNATFRDVDLKGDFVNTMTKLGALNLTFDKSTVTGAISTGTQAPITGKKPTRGTYYLIGAVKNTFGPTTEKFGANVTLNDGSRWVVDKTSYLTGLTIAQGTTVTAPQGMNVTMTVNGVKTQLKNGTYKGKIVLRVGHGA